MKLKKIIFPLTFLGLSPTNANAAKTTKPDSVPQNKTELSFSEITLIPQDTLDFWDEQEKNLNAIEQDSIAQKEMRSMHIKLLNSYNASPNKHNFTQIIEFLNKIENPHLFYNKMQLSIKHAKYLTENITPELQKKLQISDISDIMIDAINKRTNEIPDQDAFNFIILGQNFDKLQQPAVIMDKALKYALSDINALGSSFPRKKCISLIMEYATQNQNDTEIVKLYSTIFITTAKIIREFNESNENQSQQIQAMNTLVPLIENFNSKIIPNSILDHELQIKKPHDYVINEYNNIFYRINLAKIYNDAYFYYMMKSPNLHKQIYSNQLSNEAYVDYVQAIELQSLARTTQLSQEQQTQLDNLIKKRPEIKLFEPYYSNVYLNTEDKKKINDFLRTVKSSKKNEVSVPASIAKILKNHQTNADTQKQIILDNYIKLPEIKLTLPNKFFYNYIMSSSMISSNVFNNIKSALRKQYDDVLIQKQSLERITQNNKTSVYEQKER